MEWIDSKKEPPRKNCPIIVAQEFAEIPKVVRWVEDGTYGKPGFFESNDEHETKEKDIDYWMPAPKPPKKEENEKILHAFECECEICKEKWRNLN